MKVCQGDAVMKDHLHAILAAQVQCTELIRTTIANILLGISESMLAVTVTYQYFFFLIIG